MIGILKNEGHQIVYFIITSAAKHRVYYNVGVGKGAPVNKPTFSIPACCKVAMSVMMAPY
jgi:hypothetical protein